MSNLIVVHRNFDAHWPWVADHLHRLWKAQGTTDLVRLPRNDQRPLGQVTDPVQGVRRLVSLGVPVTQRCLARFPELEEVALVGPYGELPLDEAAQGWLQSRGIHRIRHHSEGFWGQSVAEFALALTLCGLRRIPQNYAEMRSSHDPWLRYRAEENRGPGQVGVQYSDDGGFTNGTLAGKRVRVIGAGNIGSRYASFAHALGAQVAAWDPFAPEPAFHRAGSRREHHLERLVADAQIFAPMLPLTESTRGLVTAQLIRQLPRGCLVVLATRALICDMVALRARVLADEISLAADVFDQEPLPLEDPLIGRHNVVHTPHLAGRTRDANLQWAEALAAQFRPILAVDDSIS